MLAHTIGATVYTTVGSEEKAAVARDLGADYVINYKQADFLLKNSYFNGRKGIDVILDIIGGDYVEKRLSSCWQIGARYTSGHDERMLKKFKYDANDD